MRPIHILVLYQKVQSGATKATESLVAAYRLLYPCDKLIIHKQTSKKFVGRFAFILNMFWSMWDFRRALNVNRSVDLIISTQFTFAIPWQLSTARKIPAIFHVHGDQRFLTPVRNRSLSGRLYHHVVAQLVALMQKYALGVATRLAFVSIEAKNGFFISTAGLHLEKKSFILPNGVDSSVFKPFTTRHKRTFKNKHSCSKGIQLGCIGRLDEKKGTHLLIDALNHLPPSMTLWIIYPAPSDQYEKRYEHILKSKSQAIINKDRVRFLQNPHPIQNVYGLIDYLVLPSQQEMLPLVLLESLSCGVLPITTDVGGIKEITSQLSDTLLIPSLTPSSIAQTILHAVSLPTKKHQLLVNRAKEIVSRYSWKHSASVLRNEAEKIIPQQ